MPPSKLTGIPCLSSIAALADPTERPQVRRPFQVCAAVYAPQRHAASRVLSGGLSSVPSTAVPARFTSLSSHFSALTLKWHLQLQGWPLMFNPIFYSGVHLRGRFLHLPVLSTRHSLGRRHYEKLSWRLVNTGHVEKQKRRERSSRAA